MRAPRRRVRERSRGSAKTAPTAAPAAAGAAQGTLHHPAVCVAHPPAAARRSVIETLGYY